MDNPANLELFTDAVIEARVRRFLDSARKDRAKRATLSAAGRRWFDLKGEVEAVGKRRRRALESLARRLRSIEADMEHVEPLRLTQDRAKVRAIRGRLEKRQRRLAMDTPPAPLRPGGVLLHRIALLMYSTSSRGHAAAMLETLHLVALGRTMKAEAAREHVKRRWRKEHEWRKAEHAEQIRLRALHGMNTSGKGILEWVDWSGGKPRLRQHSGETSEGGTFRA